MTSNCNFSAVSDRSLRDNHGQSFFPFSSGSDLLPVSVAEVSSAILYISQSRVRTNYQLLDRSKMVSAIHPAIPSVAYLPETVFSTSRCHAAKSQCSYYLQAGIWEFGELYLAWMGMTWRANPLPASSVVSIWYTIHMPRHLYWVWLTASSKVKRLASERGIVAGNSWCKFRCCNRSWRYWHVAL